MTVVTLLQEARALISEEYHWTQRHYARDIQGVFTDPSGADAVCWCATGALLQIASDSTKFKDAEDVLSRVTDLSVPIYNDTHTHSEVLAKFDEAIALARKEALWA